MAKVKIEWDSDNQDEFRCAVDNIPCDGFQAKPSLCYELDQFIKMNNDKIKSAGNVKAQIAEWWDEWADERHKNV